MSGMWPLIGLAGMLLLGFGALVIGGTAVVHVGMRWWLMLMCGMDWDDAGALIRARYRRRHGLHADGQPQLRPVPLVAGPGFQAHLDAQPVTPGQRYDVTARLPRVPVTGNPPWAGDDTHVIPQVQPPDQVWLRPGEALNPAADSAGTGTWLTGPGTRPRPDAR